MTKLGSVVADILLEYLLRGLSKPPGSRPPDPGARQTHTIRSSDASHGIGW